MIARMTEAWIFAADSCFCHFGVTLPYLEVSWHTKEVGKFSTQAASRGGVEDNDSQDHVPHLHGVVGHFHMPDLHRRNSHCHTTKTRRTRIKILMQIACMLLLGADALS